MKPFTVTFDPLMIDDLRQRIASTRWPVHGVGDDWSRGVPPAYLKDLATYWRDEFDWARAEQKLNRFPQFVESLAGLDVHFYYVYSGQPGATAVLLTHGWPSTPAEFLAVMDRVHRDNATGSSAPIDLVVPTLPHHGLTSTQPGERWDVVRIASAWAELMSRLGHEQYVAVGGDWGSLISLELARQAPESVTGALCSMVVVPARADGEEELTPTDLERLTDWQHFDADLSGYLKVQSTRPSTIGYGLNDSPVGQLAWTIEKFKEWNRHNALPEDRIDRDQLLLAASLYWAHMSAADSAHLYYDSGEHLAHLFHGQAYPSTMAVPLGVMALQGDTTPPVETLVRAMYPSLVHWSEHPGLGHFAAMEEPDTFVDELHNFLTVLAHGAAVLASSHEKEGVDVARAS